MTAKDFLLRLPEKVRPEALDGLQTNFHFDIGGEEETKMTVIVENGAVKVEEGLIGDPACTVKAKDEHFIKVVSGKLNPMMALLTGKLKISNQGEMLKYAKIFGLM